MLHYISIAQTKLLSVIRDCKGVSATEYTLMVVGIAAAVLGGATILGTDISAALNSIGSYLSGQGAKL